MKPKEIEDLLELMLSKAGEDIDHKYLAWQAANLLYRFWSEIDHDIYAEDPISQHAPSECFGDHMKAWENLENLIQQNYLYVENKWQESMAELHLQPTEVSVEDIPF